MPDANGPTPDLPIGGYGYQVGYGDTSEPILGVQGAPTEITDAATLTAAQLKTGLLVLTSAGGDTYTLPTVALWETALGGAENIKVNASYDFAIVSLSGTSTLAVGTGWTIVGGDGTAQNESTIWRARKTAAGAWTAYRIAG